MGKDTNAIVERLESVSRPSIQSPSNEFRPKATKAISERIHRQRIHELLANSKTIHATVESDAFALLKQQASATIERRKKKLKRRLMGQ
ncbi:MAG: hypothetical protein UU25_C0026G0007 [Microgenomates group bacterium GW2011_GWB1_40_9]|nr:MAG: hypothetical protein UT26_C0034G0014 [Microgenomates group bacterium GW2011_GWC1_39_12]KKR78966.1 MAG: hypothetical protein UU25_C0026G0007 [Microgenomates group bacterium GW2011_GWB1_40_9]